MIDPFKPKKVLNPDGTPMAFGGDTETNYAIPFSETNLMPGQRDLDNYSKALLDEKYSRAMDAAAEDQFLKGDSSRNPFANALSSKAMGDAISRKYEKEYGDDLNAIMKQFDYQSPIRSTQRLTDVNQQFGKRERLKLQNYAEQMAYYNRQEDIKRQYELAKQQSRDGFFASLLGLVGTVGGALLTGGASIPASIAAGAGTALSASRSNDPTKIA